MALGAVCLFGAVAAIEGSLAAVNVNMKDGEGAAGVDISLGAIEIQAVGDATVTQKLPVAETMPGTVWTNPYSAVCNTAKNGYPLYAKVVADHYWAGETERSEAEQEIKLLDFAPVKTEQEQYFYNDWLVTYADGEQTVLYYRKPLKSGERSTDFLSEISFPAELGNDYADGEYRLDLTVTAVQADNGRDAIAAELGVFPIFDEAGNLIRISERRPDDEAKMAEALAVQKPVQTVSLTKKDELVYKSDGDALAEAFMGMSPGDTRLTAIALENHNPHEAAFFLSQTTVKALENIRSQAKGAAYDYELLVEKEGEEIQSLLRTEAGGYDRAMHASTMGLSDIKELENDTFVVKLKTGESAKLYLMLHLDGEGMDSGGVSDYSNAAGALELSFRACYAGETEPTVITQSGKEKTHAFRQLTEQIKSVKTGDTAPIAAAVCILSVGAVCVVMAFRKKRGGSVQ